MVYKSGNSIKFTSLYSVRVTLSLGTLKHKKAPETDEYSLFENGVFCFCFRQSREKRTLREIWRERDVNKPAFLTYCS